MIPYESIDHTADLGLRIYGKDLPELFRNAGVGFTDQITEVDALTPKIRKEIQIKGENIEALLVGFLKELLYLFDTRQLLFCKFTRLDLSDTLFICVAEGEELDLSKHTFKTALKAVTHHLLKIEKAEKGYQATVIFDV